MRARCSARNGCHAAHVGMSKDATYGAVLSLTLRRLRDAIEADQGRTRPRPRDAGSGRTDGDTREKGIAYDKVTEVIEPGQDPDLGLVNASPLPPLIAQ